MTLLEVPALSPESWGMIAGMALTVGAGVVLGIRKGWQVIIPILKSTNKATAEIREQVANTHATNLRVDMDVITDITSRIERKADDLTVTLGHVHDIVSRHDVELKRVNDHIAAQGARVTALDQRVTNVKAATDQVLHDHSVRIHEVETKQHDWRDNP